MQPSKQIIAVTTQEISEVMGQSELWELRGGEGREKAREGLARLPGQGEQGSTGTGGWGPRRDLDKEGKNVLPPQSWWGAVGGQGPDLGMIGTSWNAQGDLEFSFP